MEEEIFNKNSPNWCEYCKEPVQFTDNYVVKKGKIYHLFCFKQLNTFVDDEQYEEEEIDE